MNNELQTYAGFVFSVGLFFCRFVFSEVLTLYPTDIFTARDGASSQNLELNQGIHLEPNENM